MTGRPFVSIVIPVRNEKTYIGRCIRCIFKQDYSLENIEVIVVDGESDDGTLDVIREFSFKNEKIKIIQNPLKIVPAAMNIGIRATKGDFIIRVDARCFIEPDYVSKCVYYLQTTGAWNVGGRQNATGEGSLLEDLIMSVTTSPFGIGGSKFHFSKKAQYVDTVYLGAYPRWIFEKIGLYDESLIRNQDYELNYRIREAGGTIFFTPEIRSVYYGRTTLSKFRKQYFQYGFWKVRVLKKHPGSMKIRHLAAPLFVLILSICIIAAIWRFELLIVGAGIMILYFCAAIFSSFIALNNPVVTKNKPKLLSLMPWFFLVLHVCWGIGFFVEFDYHKSFD